MHRVLSSRYTAPSLPRPTRESWGIRMAAGGPSVRSARALSEATAARGGAGGSGFPRPSCGWVHPTVPCSVCTSRSSSKPSTPGQRGEFRAPSITLTRCTDGYTQGGWPDHLAENREEDSEGPGRRTSAGRPGRAPAICSFRWRRSASPLFPGYETTDRCSGSGDWFSYGRPGTHITLRAGGAEGITCFRASYVLWAYSWSLLAGRRS